MKTLNELLAEKATLEAEIAKARKGESEAALQRVQALVKEFGFSAQQVFPWKPLQDKGSSKHREDSPVETVHNAQGPFLAEMAAAAARN